MRRVSIPTAAALTGAVLAWTLTPGGAGADPSQSESNKRPYTDEFAMDDCTFVADDSGSPGNPLWIPLNPGNQVVLEDEETELHITVCDNTAATCDGAPGLDGILGTELIDGVTTRVIEEREWDNGDLVEVSRNYFARCEENNAIFYFGEDVDIYEDDVVVSHEGAWRAGVDGATAGVVMPGLFLLGARYFQERAVGVAEDRAENTDIGLEIETPLDDFEGCVRVIETSELASNDLSLKEYCPDVGLVNDDGAEIVSKNF